MDGSRLILVILAYAFAIFAILYFAVIMPGKKKNKQTRAMHDSIKVGDKVTTVGGLIGVVTWRDADTVKLLVDEATGTTETYIVYAIQQIISQGTQGN